jgi:hypothetical protein
VVIKASSRKEVDALIADLRSEHDVARDAAAARLAVIGARAVDRLLAVACDQAVSPASRVSALGALEAIGDSRTVDTLLGLVDGQPDELASGAVRALRSFLGGAEGLRVLDRLTSVAMDRQRSDQVRATALQTLKDLDASTLKPIVDALRRDPSPAIVALTSGDAPPPRIGSRASKSGSSRLLDRAADGAFPPDAADLHRAIAEAGSVVSLSTLHRIIERLRDRERDNGRNRREWMTARGAAHAALASRGSRLALYDLRESLEAALEPLPVEFLTALTAIGDASCLEAVAGAYDRSADGWWKRHLADAFRTIAVRERSTRRHGVVRRIARRWPEAFAELWTVT